MAGIEEVREKILKLSKLYEEVLPLEPANQIRQELYKEITSLYAIYSKHLKEQK